MRITVLTVGKIKEKYLVEGIREYEKRLSRYCKLEIIEVGDEMTPEGAGEAQERQIKEKEALKLKKHIREDSFVIVLAIEGESLDSLELAHKIHKLGVDGVSHLIFVIGGSLGLDQAILSRGDLCLSFSKMTFPHQMMRMILLEQIYRAYRINYKQPYHK